MGADLTKNIGADLTKNFMVIKINPEKVNSKNAFF
jgi:hypothetical protein